VVDVDLVLLSVVTTVTIMAEHSDVLPMSLVGVAMMSVPAATDGMDTKVTNHPPEGEW